RKSNWVRGFCWNKETLVANQKLLNTIGAISRLVERHPLSESTILEEAQQLIAGLVAKDDWLPSEMACPHPQYYRQYLLYGDPSDRFSLVSFVWGPGQKTPVHDHTVWGVIGMLRGAEIEEPYRIAECGLERAGESRVLMPG